MDNFSRNGKADPDTHRCRTTSVGASIPGTGRELFYCGTDNTECRYARPFGFDCLCKHPDGHSFS
jgi:hypothetical protein